MQMRICIEGGIVFYLEVSARRKMVKEFAHNIAIKLEHIRLGYVLTLVTYQHGLSAEVTIKQINGYSGTEVDVSGNLISGKREIECPFVLLIGLGPSIQVLKNRVSGFEY